MSNRGGRAELNRPRATSSKREARSSSKRQARSLTARVQLRIFNAAGRAPCSSWTCAIASEVRGPRAASERRKCGALHRRVGIVKNVWLLGLVVIVPLRHFNFEPYFAVRHSSAVVRSSARRQLVIRESSLSHHSVITQSSLSHFANSQSSVNH